MKHSVGVIFLFQAIELIFGDECGDLQQRLDALEKEINSLKQRPITRDGHVDVTQCAYKEYWGTIASMFYYSNQLTTFDC